jgi:hypothetical protein
MNETVFTETFIPGELVTQIFVGARATPVVITYNVIDSTPTSLVLKPIGNHLGVGDDIITFTCKKGIPLTYRQNDYDRMFVDYLRNTERLPGAIMKADFNQKDLDRQIASLKKISDLWTEIRRKQTEENQ